MTEKKTARNKEKAAKDTAAKDAIPGGVSPGLMPPVNAGGGGCRFSKRQLLSSKRFRDRRDILEALIREGELYTVEDVEGKINRYMKGKVE